MRFNDIAKDWVDAGCKLVEDNKDNPKMYAHGVQTALNTMLETFAEVPVIEWHKYPKEKPRRKGVYLVTLDWTSDEKKVWAMRYDKEVPFGREVIAWAEMPEPY